ncbi:hypothetical protein M0802_000763 [Mischocyttarus mexicanus]|nr:hypothetical protein M0802_000763 [Mischocyttarus mexicanus]
MGKVRGIGIRERGEERRPSRRGSALLTYCGSKTGSLLLGRGQVTSKIIPVIKLTSRRLRDEGKPFIAFMGTCSLLV